MYGKKELIETYGFYNSTKWLKVATKIRKKYNYTCQDCGKRGTTIHHINPLTQDDYIRRPLNKCYGEDNLICLCHDCHEKRHTKKRLRDGLYFDKEGQLQIQEDEERAKNI